MPPHSGRGLACFFPGDFGGDGFGGCADEQFAVLVAVVVGLAPESVRAVEMRHHIALHQLEMALGRREVGPVVRKLQEGAEAARAFLQELDMLDHVVRRADDRHAVFRQIGDRIVDLRRHDREGRDLTEILGPEFEAELDIPVGLLACLGDMGQRDDAPVLAVHRLAVLGRRSLAEFPVVRVRLQRLG